MPLPFLESDGASITVTEFWGALERAAADPRIKAVILEPRGTAMGWAKMQEIRDDLIKFKKSGKPIYAYLHEPTLREYYIASAADKIYLLPTDVLYIKGLRAELTFYKGVMDKIGVQMEMEHAGKYKDYLDSYVRTSMTPESREALNSILDDLYGQLVSGIATGRNKTEDEVRAIIDDGPQLAKAAVEKGLVDATLFEDQFLDEVKKKIGATKIKKVSIADYNQANRSGDSKNRIAVLVGEGAISRGLAPVSPFGETEGITPTAMIKQIRLVRDDSSIKGVILRVDSPGGEVTPSDEILREIQLLSQKKPMVISMSDVAASGGYWISMTGDPIVAYPGTITGSIGVIMGKINLRGLYDKLGITKDTLIRGKYANIDSESTPLDADGRRKLHDGIEATYQQFLAHVSRARKRDVKEIEDLAQGRAWLGTQAKSRGLVDEIGGLDRTIQLIKEKAKIPAGDKVSLILYPAKKNFFEQFLAKSQQASTNMWLRLGGQDATVIPFEKELGAELGFSPRIFLNGGALSLSPYRISIR